MVGVNRSEASALFARLAIAASLGLFVSHRLLFEPGVISLMHDWAIPPFGEQNISLARQIFDGWYRWGIGVPVTYPTAYPLMFLLAGLSRVGVPGGALSKAVVVAIPAVAFLSAAGLGRRLGLTSPSSFVAGGFYALCPVMFNKLASGQLAYLVAYAALPSVLTAYLCGITDRLWGRAALVLATALALSCIEIQVGMIACGLIVAFASLDCTASVLHRLRLLASAFLMVLVIQLPTVLGLIHGATALIGQTEFLQSLSWLDVNSIAPLDGIRLVGYLTHYFSRAVSSWSSLWMVVSWIVVGAVTVGIACSPRHMRMFSISVLVPTLIFAAGTKSVFAPAVIWLFMNVRAAEVFRELYHLMVVPALVFSMALGSLHAWIVRFRSRTILRAGLVVLLGLYAAPILSGNLCGWLRAYPIDGALRDAFEHYGSGYDRVAWFPMDQPLSFQGSGNGVDPLGITERGSLWTYSLNWPLTAVNMYARAGDSEGLKNGLRALSVADVVQRHDFSTRLMTFAFGLKAPLYSQPLDLSGELGPPIRSTSDYSAYKLAHPWPEAFAADRIAIAPRRLDVLGRLADAGYVPVNYGTLLPDGMSYIVVRDQGDFPEEAASRGLALTMPMYRTVDARRSFAPLSMWAWYRPSYADTSNGELAIGVQKGVAVIRERYSHGVLILAWIATPLGGRLRVTVNENFHVIDTYSPDDRWESAALPIGSIYPGTRLVLQAMDPGAEVALRSMRLMSAASYLSAVHAYQESLRRAARVITLAERVGTYAPVRSGSTGDIGALSPRYRYRLTVHYVGTMTSFAVVKDRAGYTVALIRCRPATQGVAAVAFDGMRGNWKIVGARGVTLGAWKIERAKKIETRLSIAHGALRAGAIKGTSVTFPSRHRALVLNVTFDRGWKLNNIGDATHIPSALNTNVWILRRRPATVISGRYALSTPMHMAFIAGSSMIAAGTLIFLFTGASETLKSTTAAQEPVAATHRRQVEPKI